MRQRLRLERIPKYRLLRNSFGSGVERAGSSFARFFHHHGTSPQRIGTRSRLPSSSTTVSIVSVGQTL